MSGEFQQALGLHGLGMMTTFASNAFVAGSLVGRRLVDQQGSDH
jgi:hypothetical protein